MIPLLSSTQIRAWDAYTIANQPISDFALMEQAARAFVNAFCKHYSQDISIYVLVGTGNNGGDGLCIARFLQESGYTVEVFFFGEAKSASPSCHQALQLYKNGGKKLSYFKNKKALAKASFSKNKKRVWIDALFGTGLSRPLQGSAQALVEWLNELSVSFVAVDVPSGLLLSEPQKEAVALRADRIISLQVPKAAFLLPENAPYVGKWERVDIGLHQDFLSDLQPEQGYLLEKKDMRGWLPERPRYLHKGAAGEGLLVAGSRGMFGAAILSAQAAMRGGIGLLHVHVPKEGVLPLQIAAPEALVRMDSHPVHLTGVQIPPNVGAIAIGPGLGKQLPSAAALRQLFQEATQPLILDADALNLLATYPELLAELPADSLLTPHPGELRRLLGTWKDDYDKLARLQAFSQKIQGTVLLKGAYTVMASPGKPLWFNPTGNPGMATAGAGDVLTGLLLALRVALPTAAAAATGAFLHGLAGDLAAQNKGTHSLIASDIIDYLPQAFIEVQNES